MLYPKTEISGTIKVMKSDDVISTSCIGRCSDIIGCKLEVIELFDQYLPGKPGQYKMYYPDDGYSDDAEARVHAFEKCLKQVIVYFKKEVQDDRIIIACPCYIGCGLAGGCWALYRKLLIKANKSLDKLNVEIVLYLL